MLKTAYKRWLCAFLFFFMAAALAIPQDTPSLPPAATEFVQMILSRSGSPAAIAVTFQNLSSLSPEAQEATQNAIFNGFRSANVRVVKPEQAVAEVHITFSEDWRGYILICIIPQGTLQPRVMREFPPPHRGQMAPSPTINTRNISVLLWHAPLLDFFHVHHN